MRTINTINNNINTIASIRAALKAQIELLENEYQKNAIEISGERCDSYSDIQEKLEQANQALNILQHFEIDTIDYIKYGEDAL